VQNEIYYGAKIYRRGFETFPQSGIVPGIDRPEGWRFGASCQLAGKTANG